MRLNPQLCVGGDDHYNPRFSRAAVRRGIGGWEVECGGARDVERWWLSKWGDRGFVVDEHTQALGPGERHYFLIRRLHSLLGLVPIGVFVCIHLATNATILFDSKGGSAFQWAVEIIHLPEKLHRNVLIAIEIVGIFLPLLFHSLLGLQIAFSGRSNPQHYRYGGNIRYTLQRITAYIALVFILYHVWHMHWLGAGVGGGTFQLEDSVGNPAAAVSTAKGIQAAVWIAPLYAVGVIATVFHLANGIWTALITWGITIKPRSQQIAGYVCAVFGVLLTLVGLGALQGFKTFDTSGDVASSQVAGTTATMVIDGEARD